MEFKKILSTKTAFFLILILVAFLGQLKYKQWKQQRQIDIEKDSLIAQTEALEAKNKQLEESLSYLNSEEFKERVARQQLNLKKEGEIVFNFTQSPGVQGISMQKQDAAVSGSNFEKWIKYFSKK